jgi:hypothetical protein
MKMRKALAGILLLSTVAAGCYGASPTDADTEPEVLVGTSRLVLLSPVDGATIPQNVPSPECSAHPLRGSGFRISFDWSDSRGADGTGVYWIVVQHAGSTFPLVDTTVSGSDYVYQGCGFVIDSNLADWHWR